MKLPAIENHTVVRRGDTVIASPDRLKAHISPLLNAISELNDAVDPLVIGGLHDVKVIIEMHPAAFRDLLHTLYAHLDSCHLFTGATSKPGEFQLYNITFRAVPPAKDTPR